VRIDRDNWNRISALLDHALELQPNEIPGWLAQLAQRDPAAACTLQELLSRRAIIATGSFLDSLPQLQDSTAAPEPAHPGGAFSAGTRVGPYLLESELGRGGMGSVWRARRDDGTFTRTVALKLPFAEHYRREFIDRFCRERDILAALAHPHIARLYDAGITAEGQPYLAMEYVEGVPLTQYCGEHRASLATRLALFAQVLDAVGYAHSNLILHRDLKPSNILVTPAGNACLLDFGIAKLLPAGDADSADLTQFTRRMLTPGYASPEQIAGAPLGVASDIYSLGVLLYELLSAERPYRLTRRSVAALEEAILSADPQKPSQAVGDAVKAAEIGGMTVAQLRRALSGDLDTITLKALKKEPSLRYVSVDALGGDLQRYRAGLPVLARPDAPMYLLRKFIARHRLTVTVTVLVALALAATTGISVHQARLARAQAIVARNESDRAQAVQQFLQDIFRTNTHLQSDPLKARQTTARELLDAGAARVGQQLQDAPQAQAEVLMTLADMYTQMGLDAQAAQLRLRRIEALKKAGGSTSVELADAMLDYVVDISTTPERSQIPQLLQEARRILDTVGDFKSETRAGVWMESGSYLRYTAPERMQTLENDALRLLAASAPNSWIYQLALDKAGYARFELGDYAGAEAIFRKSLGEVHRRVATTSAWEISPLAGLAAAQAALGEFADAERNFRASLAASLARNGDAHVETHLAQSRLGAFLHATSRVREGLQLQAEALEGIRRGTVQENSTTAAGIRAQYGRSLLAEGGFDTAGEYLTRDVETLDKTFPQSTLLAAALLEHGKWATLTGRYREAQADLDQALALRRSIGGKASAPALENPYLLAQGELALAQGDAQGAMQWAQHMHAAPAPAYRLAMVDEVARNTLLAEALSAQGRFAESLNAAQAAVDAAQHADIRNYIQVYEANALLALGESLRRGGKAQTAVSLLRQALSLRLATDEPNSAWLAQIRISLAQCLLDLNQNAEAKKLYEQASASQSQHADLGLQFLQPQHGLAKRLQSFLRHP
jgi:serine/threonine-protein kinase